MIISGQDVKQLIDPTSTEQRRRKQAKPRTAYFVRPGRTTSRSSSRRRVGSIAASGKVSESVQTGGQRAAGRLGGSGSSSVMLYLWFILTQVTVYVKTPYYSASALMRTRSPMNAH